MTTYKMHDHLKRTPCERCIAIKKNGQRCKNMTCKWSPMCWAHRQVNVQESTIDNAGEGGFARIDLKKGTIVGRYTVGTIKLHADQLPPMNDRSHIWQKNVNTFFDAERTNSVAGKYNSCTSQDAKLIGCKNNAKYTSVGNVKLTKNVKKGAEIFVPYGRDYWRT